MLRARSQALLLVAAALLAGCASPQPSPEPAPGGFSSTDVFAGAYDTSGPWPRALVPGTLEALADEVVEVPSELDGEPIQIGFVRPDVPEGVRVPVVAHASVYLSDLRAAPLVDAYPYPPESGFLVENLVPRGYAVAWIAARGTGGSGGCWDVYGPETRADLSQAVTWLAEQPWSDGAVGMIGISWDAVAAWQVAASGNPHLRTVVVAASEPDLFSFFFRNGTASGAGTGGQAGFWATSTTGTTTFFGVVQGESPRGPSPRDPSSADPCPDLAAAIADSGRATVTGERGSGFWKERDLRPIVAEAYGGTALVVHGLRDDFAWARLVYPWIAEVEARGLVAKHMLGQWGHDLPYFPNPTPRWDFAEILVRWYDAWLKGGSVDLGGRVQVADSDGAWRAEPSWPPPDAARRTFWLAPGGALADAPSTERGSALLVADPERAVLGPEHAPDAADGAFAECRGCAWFATEPIEGGLRFAGLPEVPLTVTPTGPGGSVSAFLYVDGPNGTRRLSAGILDLRFADGGETARAVSPGQPIVARLQLEAVDAVVPDGGRLLLAVGQVGYGAVLNYYRPTEPSWPVRVELGGEQSALRLLVFERGEGAFFESPAPPG